VLGIIVVCLASWANAGADPQLSVGVYLGVRQTTARAEASGVAPYSIQVPYQVYSSSLVVSALPSSKPRDDVAELKKAFGLLDAKLINETELNCEAPAAAPCDGKGRCSVSKVFDVETEGRVLGFVVVTSDTDMAPGKLRVKIFEHAREAPAAESGTGAFGHVVPSSYAVDAEIALSAAQATVLGFTDTKGTPLFVVFRRGA